MPETKEMQPAAETQANETKQAQKVNWTSYVPSNEGEISKENHHVISWETKDAFLSKFEGSVGFILRFAKESKNPFLLIENSLGQTAEGVYINFSTKIRENKDYENIDIQTRMGMDSEGTINTYFYAVTKGEQSEVIRFK